MNPIAAQSPATVPAMPVAISLFLIRIGVFVVMGIWTIDKLLNPEHAAAVFKTFYMIPGLGAAAAMGIGIAQALVVLCFLAGAFKSISYSIVLLMHTVSTLSTFARYLDPWSAHNLLFFAAWPMLAALITLVILRRYDTILSFDSLRARKRVHTVPVELKPVGDA